jgi:hypothetical protein
MIWIYLQKIERIIFYYIILYYIQAEACSSGINYAYEMVI